MFSPGSVSVADLSSLRSKLEKAAKGWKGGVGKFSLLFQIADVFEAPTYSEFRRRMADLPVSIRNVVMTDGDGSTRIRRDYYVHGVLKISLFLNPQKGASTAASVLPAGTPDLIAPLLDPEICAWEYEGNYFMGECATQQDLDDAYATMAALEYDVEEYEEELNDGIDELCDRNPDADLCYPPETPPQFAGGFSNSDASCPPSSVGTGPVLVGPGECVGAGIAAVASLVGWGAAKYTSYSVMQAVSQVGVTTVARGALTWAVGGSAAAAFGVGFGVGTFIACLTE